MMKDIKFVLKDFADMGIVMMIPALMMVASCTQHAKAFPFAMNTARAETYCNPERSKPCGGGCITKDKTCRKSWTTSKVGINPGRGSGPGYDNPKYVSEAPKK